MEILKNMTNKHTISIIEDSKIYCEWLKLELSKTNHLELVSVDQSGKSGLESIKKLNPQLILLDFQLSDMTGLEVVKRIKAFHVLTKIFILTAHDNPSILERIIEDKNIDAVAIKGSSYFELNFISAIDCVLNGGTYLEPSILSQLRKTSKHLGLSSLTRREFELFIQIKSGKSDQQISRDLFVHISHIRNLKSKISKKVNNTNIDGILKKLIENSLVQ